MSVPMSAQLNEQFTFSTTSTFPPTGWTETNAATAPYIWNEASLAVLSLGTLLVDSAAHEYSVGGLQCESYLVTPKMNLSALSTPQLTFDSDLYWILYMAHTGSIGGGLANGISTVKTSTDGGVTWSAPVWTEAALADGFTPGIIVDLASVAGQSSVNLAFHYSGDFAHDWGVDNVVVDNGGAPTGPSLTIVGTCPGPGSIDCAGMTPGGLVYVGYGFAAGSWAVPAGPCAGATVGVISPTLLFAVSADGAGNVSIPGVMPASACGVVQMVAFDVTTCTGTNVVAI